MKSKSFLESEIIEVENTLNIDLQKLFKELASRKGKELTDQEKYYLCRLLLGDEPIEIARLQYYTLFTREINNKDPNLTDKETFLFLWQIYFFRWTIESESYSLMRHSSNKVRYLLQEILENRIRKKAADIRTYMARTINSYINDLMYDYQEKLKQSNREKRPNWLKIVCVLINNGYKKEVALEQTDRNRKIIILETKGDLQLKNLSELLQNINQKFGDSSLVIEKIIQQEETNDE